jgi:hypothetical protein
VLILYLDYFIVFKQNDDDRIHPTFNGMIRKTQDGSIRRFCLRSSNIQISSQIKFKTDLSIETKPVACDGTPELAAQYRIPEPEILYELLRSRGET